MPYDNERDRERRLAYQREYFNRLYAEGKQWQQRPENKPYLKAKRRRRTLREYGLTTEAWDAKFVEQGRACAICHSTETANNHWHTDHHHETGTFRGILCKHCNNALGQFKDDVAILRSAVAYLVKGGEI